jgi:hypothetical protein
MATLNRVDSILACVMPIAALVLLGASAGQARETTQLHLDSLIG